MKIALAQMKNEGSITANLEKSLQLLREAAEGGADLILYPEVQLTEFFPQYSGLDVEKYRVAMDSGIVRAFRNECRKCRIMAVPNIYLFENGKTYDASLLIGNGGNVIGTQKMVHIADAPYFHEQDYYTPSDDGFHVFDTEFGRIGIVICFDRHYPESIRTEALMGADLILIPTANTKAEPSEMFEWEIRVQSYENSAAVAMCNRVGREDRMDFSGESVVTDAEGSVLLYADDAEALVYADVDLKKSGEVRKSRSYTQLRRPDMYL